MSPRATVYQHYLHLDILRVLGPQWATGATKWILHERHVGWAIVDLLDPHWALRATIWTTCRSRSFLSFWVLSELQEPIYITSCRSRHFMSSGFPVSRRCHCMNHRYIDVFAGLLCPQWAVGATIWTTRIPSYLWVFLIPSEPQEPLFGPHVDLPLYRHSGSLVIPGSQYISPPCISSHSQLSWSPVNHRSQYINQMFIQPFTFFLHPHWAPRATLYQEM